MFANMYRGSSGAIFWVHENLSEMHVESERVERDSNTANRPTSIHLPLNGMQEILIYQIKTHDPTTDPARPNLSFVSLILRYILCWASHTFHYQPSLPTLPVCFRHDLHRSVIGPCVRRKKMLGWHMHNSNGLWMHTQCMLVSAAPTWRIDEKKPLINCIIN